LRIIPTRPDNFVFIFEKPIHAEFFVIVQSELTDNRAERDLWRFHVHLVENLHDFHHDLAIAQNDDSVGALVGDDFGVADRDRFGCSINRLCGKFLGDVEIAFAGGAGLTGIVWIRDGWIGRALWRCSRLGPTSSAGAALLLFPPGLGQGLHQHRQNITRGNVTQRPRHRFGKLNVGVELGDQFPDKRHVDRPGDDVNAIRPHIGRELDFTHDNRLLGKRRERAEIGLALRHGHDRIGNPTHSPAPRTPRTTRHTRSRLVTSFLENVFQHVTHLGGVGAFELDEFTRHFSGGDINLIDDLG
jgi:hypothetical protein